MWDDEIDAAARAVTERRLPPDLRSRALARIEARHGRPRWRPIGPLAAAGAVVAVILLVLVVSMRDRHDPGPGESVASNTEAAASDQQSAAATRESTSSRPIDTHAEAPAPTRIAQARSDSRGDRSPAMSLADDPTAVEDLALPLLMPEQRLVNDPLTTDQLVTESIALNALELTPLDDQVVSQ